MGYIPDIDISGKSDCSLTYDEFINQETLLFYFVENMTDI